MLVVVFLILAIGIFMFSLGIVNPPRGMWPFIISATLITLGLILLPLAWEALYPHLF